MGGYSRAFSFVCCNFCKLIQFLSFCRILAVLAAMSNLQEHDVDSITMELDDFNASGSPSFDWNSTYDSVNCTNTTLCRSRDNYIDYDYDNSTILFYFILWNIVTPMLFALIIVVGTVGNVLVIYVIMSRVTMQTTTNYLLINLALSDLAFLIIVAPITAYKYVAMSFPFGDTVCKVIQYIIYVTTYVTVYTLIAVSFLRYITVIHSVSTARYRTKRNIIIINIMIWVLLMIVNIPTLLKHQLNVFDEYFSYCGLATNSTKPFYLTFFIFGYGLPLVIICGLYCVIIHYLHMASASAVGQTRRRTARASKVIILVVVVFAVLWLPQHVTQLLQVFGTVPKDHWFEVVRIICISMIYGNSCANPIIYNFVSKEFKRGFREVVCCKKPMARRNRNGTGTAINTDNGLTTVRTAML